jgi:hypothetical protein
MRISSSVRICLLFLLLVVFVPSVLGIARIGVTPPLVNINYGDEISKERSFTILPDGKDYVKLFALSDLKEVPVVFHGIENPGFVVLSGRTEIFYHLDLSDNDLTPGEHKIKIYIQQIDPPLESGESRPAGIIARAAVVHVVKLFVPHNGPFLQMDFNQIGSVDAGDPLEMNFRLSNLGKSAVENLGLDVLLLDKSGAQVGSVSKAGISLPSLSEDTVVLTWPTTGQEIGQYIAKATARYDDQIRENEQQFLIGDIHVEIDNVIINTTKNVGKVTVEMTSQWNEVLADITARFVIKDNQGNEFKTVESSQFTLNPWASHTVDLFFERDDLAYGVYLGEVHVSYLDRVSTRILEFYNGKDFIQEKPISFFTATNFLLTVIILLLMGLIAVGGYFVMYLHHHDTKGKRKK